MNPSQTKLLLIADENLGFLVPVLEWVDFFLYCNLAVLLFYITLRNALTHVIYLFLKQLAYIVQTSQFICQNHFSQCDSCDCLLWLHNLIGIRLFIVLPLGHNRWRTGHLYQSWCLDGKRIQYEVLRSFDDYSVLSIKSHKSFKSDTWLTTLKFNMFSQFF